MMRDNKAGSGSIAACCDRSVRSRPELMKQQCRREPSRIVGEKIGHVNVMHDTIRSNPFARSSFA